MKTLTLSEAIKEGYTHCGYDGRDYQSMHEIAGLSKEDFEDCMLSGERFILADKEPIYFAIGHSEIMDFITDRYHDDDQFQLDDTNEAEELVKDEESYFQGVADKINSMFLSRPFYILTDIVLKP